MTERAGFTDAGPPRLLPNLAGGPVRIHTRARIRPADPPSSASSGGPAKLSIQTRPEPHPSPAIRPVSGPYEERLQMRDRGRQYETGKENTKSGRNIEE